MAVSKSEYIAEHFPEVESGAIPCGNKILVQLRTLKEKSSGGIFLPQETQDFNNGNTRIAIVRKLGQIAFKNRESGDEWKEGAWAKEGDLVIIPAFGGFRFDVDLGDGRTAVFATIHDYTVEMKVEDNFEAFDKVL